MCIYLEHKPIFFNNSFTYIYATVFFFFFNFKINYTPKGKNLECCFHHCPFTKDPHLYSRLNQDEALIFATAILLYIQNSNNSRNKRET